MTSAPSTPITKALKAVGSFVDNIITSSSSDLGLIKIFKGYSLSKKLGPPVETILITAIHAPLIIKDSTWAFCDRFLARYDVGEKDVIYRFLQRQDIRWADFCAKISKAFIKFHTDDVFGNIDEVAIVFDDTLTSRFGRGERQALGSLLKEELTVPSNRCCGPCLL